MIRKHQCADNKILRLGAHAHSVFLESRVDDEGFLVFWFLRFHVDGLVFWR